jgi:hypothetical protein
MQRPSKRYRPFVQALLSCGHWRIPDVKGNGHQAPIEHIGTGRRLWYETHDGGNDINSARNFASAAGKICGCTFVQPRQRKRSRKAFRGSGFENGPRFVTFGCRRIDDLMARHDEIVEDLRRLGDTAPAGHKFNLARELGEIRDSLEENYQVPPSLS